MVKQKDLEKFKKIQNKYERYRDFEKGKVNIDPETLLEKVYQKQINNSRNPWFALLPLLCSLVYFGFFIYEYSNKLLLLNSFILFLSALWSIERYISYKVLKRMQDKVDELVQTLFP